MVATYGTYQAYVPVATPQVYPPYNPPPHHDYAQFFDANGAAIAPQILLSGQIAMGAGGAVISAEYLTMNYAVTNGFADSYLPVIKSPITVRPYVETGIYVRHYQLPVALTVDLNGDPPGVDHQASFVPGGVRVTVTDPQRARIAGANANQLTSLTVTILNYLVGDELAVSTFRQGITVRFSDGVLKLSGAASVADYQDLLRELTFKTTAARPTGSTVRIRIGATDSAGVSAAAVSTISIHVPGRSSIAGRHIFYNNSGFDGHNPAANAGDDAAIAADKVALLPNQTATFANYTTYTAGINGIMIDLAGEHGAISADDFIFRVGNRNDPAHWSYLPPPQIVVRTGAGVGGSDRIEIIWPDNTIRNAWLQVIMLDNGDTGLVAPDIFLFGNQVGESGNAPDEARVGAADVMRVVKHLLGGGDRTAALNSPLDFNRDGTISAADLMAALNRTLADPSELTLIRIEEESALDGVIRTDPTFMSYDPHPPSLVMVPLSSVVSPVIATDSVFWQFDDEELDALAQPSTLPSPLMLDPYE
jgi:hypothetical protein